MGITKDRQPCPKCRDRGEDKSGDNLVTFVTNTGKTITKCKNEECGYRDTPSYKQEESLLLTGEYEAIEERGLALATCQAYFYQHSRSMGVVQHIANYPDTTAQDVIAQHVRIVPTKQFYWKGNSKEAGFFGEHLIKQDGDFNTLYLCEGQIDAMTVYQYGNLQIGDYSVSIKTGAGSQVKDHIKEKLPLINKFKKVVIVMDSTDVGPKTAEIIAKLTKPGKAYIARLRYKDPNEYWKLGKIEELLVDLQNAEFYVPSSITTPSKELLMQPDTLGIKLFAPKLSNMIRGAKPGRLYMVLAGAKVGKSTFTKELAKDLLDQNQDIKIGVAYLEESLKDSGLSFIAMENKVPLYLLQEDKSIVDEVAFGSAYDKYIGSERVKFIDASYMSLTSPELLYHLKYMIEAMYYNIIILDHITMVTYDMGGESSERKDIDILMKELRQLVQQTQASIFTVCHLKRPSKGLSWDQGREITMTDARGSASFEQLCDVMIGLERNFYSADSYKTKIKVLANRITGQTGYADDLIYIENTGRYKIL